MPAILPIGSRAKALLLGSMARLNDIRIATKVKKMTMLGVLLKVKSNKMPPARVYKMINHRMVCLAPNRVESQEFSKVESAINRPILAKIQANNSGRP